MLSRRYWPAISCASLTLFLSTYPSSYTGAATCDCRPEINAEAEGNGWCSVTKEDAKWCKLKFNEESVTAPDQIQKFIATTGGLGIKVDIVNATRTLNSVPPKDWKPEFIDTHLLGLFSIALWDVAPDNLQQIAGIMRKFKDEIFKIVSVTEGAFDKEGFRIDGAPGCLKFSKRTFSSMVRTAFAQRGRFSLLESPDKSPFSRCAGAR